MTVETLIKKLQSYYKFYESPILVEDACYVIDYVFTKEMGFLLFASDERKAIVTPHELLVELHKVYDKSAEVYVILDNTSYEISSINSIKYPDEPGYLNINL